MYVLSLQVSIMIDYILSVYSVVECDQFGYPAYSHHDRFPPWWVFVRDDYGGNLSGDKIPP